MVALITDDQYAEAESHLPGHEAQKTYKYSFLSFLIISFLDKQACNFIGVVRLNKLLCVSELEMNFWIFYNRNCLCQVLMMHFASMWVGRNYILGTLLSTESKSKFHVHW